MRVLVVLCLLAGIARADVADRLLAVGHTQIATGYRSGRPVKVHLVEIDWALVELQTARAFLAMRDAAERDGVELVIWSGFRSNERQAELYQAWREGYGNRAARPGYSNHQLGRALDLMIQRVETRDWLAANARRFGFRATVQGEPWHWEYVPPRRKVAARRKR